MKILVVYFSFTSTVQQVAEALAGQLAAEGVEVTLSRILPRCPHGYWGWLLRSFIPGWRVRVQAVPTDLRGFDLAFLGCPKWTFACPPVNEYVRSLRADEKPVALFVCHRGFDHSRYVADLVRRLTRRGVVIVATLALKQRQVTEGEFEDQIRSFCREALSRLGNQEKRGGCK